MQRESSIEDQIRSCQEYAEKQGWRVLEAYIRFDEAISGASLLKRDALQALIDAAKVKTCAFDCLLIDDTSRLARNLPDALRTIETLTYHGIDVVSVTQGIDTKQKSARTLLTIHGMVDEQFLDGLRDKVHRGQEGRVLQGLTPGGRCFGYDNVPIEDPSRQGKYGRPAVIGVDQKFNERQATVVRRIFDLYARGMGLAAIAKLLNLEGEVSPTPAKNRSRQAWSRYSIREMLHNERYRGVVVWNRTRKVRDPETGRKVSKARPRSEWKRVESPHLRIVPEELWVAAHKRNAEVNRLGISRMGGLCRTQQSRKYLFSGLLTCGDCGSSMVIISGGGKRGYVKYGCHAHKHSGVCANNWTIRRDRLETQLLGHLESRLLRPEIVSRLVDRCQDEVRRRLAELKQHGQNSAALKQQHEDLRTQAARLAEAVAMGGDLRSLIDRLQTVEAELKKVERAMSQRPPGLTITADQIREQVVKALFQLRETLAGSEVEIARAALRKHVGRLVLTPTVKEGRKVFWVSGSISPIPVTENGVMQLVARDGIEPPTPAFSGLTSANVNLLNQLALVVFWRPKSGLQLQPIATIGSFRIAPNSDGF
jgi:site-specific DNA recombinase